MHHQLRTNLDADTEVMFEFSVPILTRKVPGYQELNQGLKDIILAKEQASLERLEDSRHRSNINGWRSGDDVLTWDEAPINALRKHVVNTAVNMISKITVNQTTVTSAKMLAFINVNRNGSYNTMHSHPNHDWAAVYYVDEGQPDPKLPESGLLEFQDPRGAAQNNRFPGFNFGKKILIPPQSGLLVMFPAWLNHFVHPYFGEGARISIAFNIKLKV